MRIIAGVYKGRKINRVNTPLTRETQDKVRGAIFNSLHSDIVGSKVLDLFSGSGAYALESLSRGASQVLMIDQLSDAVKTIRNNLAVLGINSDKYKVIKDDYKNALRKITKQGGIFDIVFIDPPYDLIMNIDDFTALNLVTSSNAILVYEMDSIVDFLSIESGIYKMYHQKKYGSKRVVYYQKEL